MIWKSLDADKVSVAKLRLDDLLREHRRQARQDRQAHQGEALQFVPEHIRENSERKPRTKASGWSASFRPPLLPLRRLPGHRRSRSDVLVVAEKTAHRVLAPLGNGIRQAGSIRLGHRHESPRQRGIAFDEVELWHPHAGEADRQG